MRIFSFFFVGSNFSKRVREKKSSSCCCIHLLDTSPILYTEASINFLVLCDCDQMEAGFRFERLYRALSAKLFFFFRISDRPARFYLGFFRLSRVQRCWATAQRHAHAKKKMRTFSPKSLQIKSFRICAFQTSFRPVLRMRLLSASLVTVSVHYR